MAEFWTQPQFWQELKLLEEISLQLIMAFVGTVAFSVLFSVPSKYYISCGITGSIGWAVYLLFNASFHAPVISTFAASIVLTAVARGLSVQCKAPTTIFLLCGIFTIVPGAGIYYTAYSFFMGAEQEAMLRGVESIKMAVAIGLGIGVAYSIPSRVFGWKKEPEVWGKERE